MRVEIGEQQELRTLKEGEYRKERRMQGYNCPERIREPKTPGRTVAIQIVRLEGE